jgi:hypothetical protein
MRRRHICKHAPAPHATSWSIVSVAPLAPRSVIHSTCKQHLNLETINCTRVQRHIGLVAISLQLVEDGHHTTVSPIWIPRHCEQRLCKTSRACVFA